jgi:AcrR family transcriptional regulator
MRGKASARGVDCNESPDALYRKLKPGPGKDAAEVAGHQQARIHSALLELLADEGYDAVTVRDLAGAAGISTRSFYKHYSGKEQCFLRVHQLVANYVLRVIETFHRSTNREERIRRTIEAVTGAWASEPKAARLLCVDAYAAGPAALKQADWTRRSIEAAIDESFGGGQTTSGSSLGAEAIVAGLYSATRDYVLLKAPPTDLEWGDRGWDAMPSRGDVTVLLSVAARLAATTSYESLSLPKLLETAGVSRRTFDANFSSMEDCFLTALELKAADALDCVRAASEGAETPEQGVHRAVVALCDRVDNDASFASLCFDASVVPGIAKMRFQQVLIGNLGEIIDERPAASGQVDRLQAQASAGSTWGVIQNHVTTGRTRELRRKAPLLTSLLLVPAVGPSVPGSLVATK